MSNKILITGATGTLGKALIERFTDEQEIVALARNESKLMELTDKYPNVDAISGDISDELVCEIAMQDVDVCIHGAAQKHIGEAEKHPYQCIGSNLIGTMNLLKHFKGSRFVLTSTDKAAKVKGVYGATKMLAERMVETYQNLHPERKYRVVRYGNVLASAGSVVLKWKDALLNGKEIIVTDPSATRFFFTIDHAVDLVFECLHKANDAKPYCPEMKSIRIDHLLEAMQIKYGKAKSIKVIGLQKGENKHEQILEDGPNSEESEKYTIKEIIELI